MEWLSYLLEANLYLLLFYGFYRLFLQHETFYNSNRYYLLLSSITAFALPIMQLGFLKPTPVVDNVAFPMPIVYGDEILATHATTPLQETFSLTDWLYPIYLLIALGFAIKLTISLFKIIRLWLKANKSKTGKITLIELNEQTTAFSFFNLLFIHPHLATKQAVLNHEMVHIKQKHSLDILFFELLQIVCWFNPIIYFIKRDIKLLHEYIADELSTNSGLHKHEYAMFLIENSFGVVPTPLTNQIFNQSILKRRINMLNKKRTAGWARLRLLMALPLVGAMLCASTMAFTKDYGYIDLLPEKSKTAATIQEKTKIDTLRKNNLQKVKPAKKDQIKFPPPIVKSNTASFFPKRDFKSSSTHPPFIENRYVLKDNQAVANLETVWAIVQASSIKYLIPKYAISKYGDKAKYGAVEITGGVIKYLKPGQVVPPPPKQDQIKFPPPIVKINKNYFYPNRSVDKEGNINGLDKRYIVVNGEKIEDINTFFGVTNTTNIVALNGPEAVKKYGVGAKYGAIEITGTDLKYVKSLADGPPPPVMEQVKFPPPVIKPNGKNLKSPPPVEPPPPGYRPKKKLKRDQVRFPPPVIKPDQPKAKIILGDPTKEQNALNLKLTKSIEKEIDSARIALKLKNLPGIIVKDN